MTRTTSMCLVLAVVSFYATGTASAGPAGPQAAVHSAAWVQLFNGTSLNGWKAAPASQKFTVREGMLLAGGPGARMVYGGKDGHAQFDNLELSIQARTEPGASARVSVGGLDVLLRNSMAATDAEARDARTGSLLGVRHVFTPVAKDGEWFTLSVMVRKPMVRIQVNDAVVVEYREPDTWPAGTPAPPQSGPGQIALTNTGAAGSVQIRQISVRLQEPLSGADVPPSPVVDATYLQILELTRAGFPVMDLHAHIKGELTFEQVLKLSRRTGMGMGVAVNCGIGFPIQDDAGAIAFVDSMHGQPVFLAMQAEGREWLNNFSKDARGKFDYVFTDGMTWTNPAGRRMRLWMPAEVEIGPDEEVFMDLLVSKIVGILENEPIDIYVNPTFIPAVLQPRYDTLWTEARMQKVIDAAVKHGVAIEINARYRIPGERFLRLAKASGATFTFGTNNTGATDLGDWSYPLEMQKRLGLTPQDMFVPGRAPSRAHRQ